MNASQCPQPNGNGACRSATCTAGIREIANSVGASCDDGNLCTVNDTCQADGQCVGTPKNCDDNNACTVDTCDPQPGTCVFTPTACNECANVADCPSESLCLHGGCFPITVAFGPDCDDRCAGDASVAILNGSFVCIAFGPGALVCATDAECPLGWTCFSNVYCVAPC